jgi:hypothetical protein
MRDSYVADVGDFGKYALLNALAGDDLRLGVLWYCNSLDLRDALVAGDSGAPKPKLAAGRALTGTGVTPSPIEATPVRLFLQRRGDT